MGAFKDPAVFLFPLDDLLLQAFLFGHVLEYFDSTRDPAFRVKENGGGADDGDFFFLPRW
jgi:hypothetical protein